MNLIQHLKNVLSPTSKNSMGSSWTKDFLKYGNRKPLMQDWSQIIMSERDKYSGYMYAAIRNRANRVANLALNNLKTDATSTILDAAKKKEDQVVHPYLTLIDNSTSFDNYRFWYEIPTYIDLEGVYYLLVVRTVESDEDSVRVGNPQEFKLLNPYEIRRVVKKDTLEVGGYIQNKKGFTREIPKQMIIEIRDLNPFDDEEPLALTDAAKDSQFTLKQAGDYTRHSLKNNMAAPGIISTDVVLEDEEFANFISRVTNQEKGLPLFGNGAGAISWDAMQIDLDKAALDKISQINLESLLAVTGMSKTTLGIEQSGVTRDTAKVMKDLLTSDHIIPRLLLIIEALNQDYKTYYQTEYTKNKYRIFIDSPLGVDHDSEIKDLEIRKTSLELYQTLVNKGYERDIAAKYANGEMNLEEIGEPTNEPVVLPMTTEIPPDNRTDDQSNPPENDKLQNSVVHRHDVPDSVHNALDENSQGLIQQQQGALQNAVVNIQERLVVASLDKVAKNQFESESDIINKEEKEEAINALEIALATFYGIVIPLYAGTVLNKRAREFGMFGFFKLNNAIRDYIKENANKAAESHIETILEDIRVTAHATYERIVNEETEKLATTTGRTSQEVLEEARKKALSGASRQQIISAIRQDYSQQISKQRAQTIARTETNRAFTRSQYEADKQFIEQNNLQGRAFKKWITRSGDPCNFCKAKAGEAPIPFDQPFESLGNVLTDTYEKQDGTTGIRRLPINYETIQAGNLHPNCSCAYILIIED